ncbi:MAG: 4Fe-4S binding protein [Promethearchaeia archaeon]
MLPEVRTRTESRVEKENYRYFFQKAIDWSNNHIFGNELRFFFKPFERVFYRFFPRLIGFANSLCKNCKLCEESCPTGAIQFKNRPIISPSDCIACFNCLRVCPTNALYFKLLPRAEYFKGPKTISGYIARKTPEKNTDQNKLIGKKWGFPDKIK